MTLLYGQVVIRGSEVVYYGNQYSITAAACRTQAYGLRGPTSVTVLLPGEYVEVSQPKMLNQIHYGCWNLDMILPVPNSQVMTERGQSLRKSKSIGHAVHLKNNTHD